MIKLSVLFRIQNHFIYKSFNHQKTYNEIKPQVRAYETQTTKKSALKNHSQQEIICNIIKAIENRKIN